MKNIWLLIFLLLLASCGLRFEPKGELVDPKAQPGFWDKSGVCNLDSLLQLGKEQNKPVLLYFTGFACVNNRKMEDKIFIYKDVYDLMHEKFIPWALYVDDMKTKLDSPYTTEDGAEIKTLGKYHQYIQQTMFKRMSQPHFVVLRADQSVVAEYQYTNLKRDFKNFLLKALEDF